MQALARSGVNAALIACAVVAMVLAVYWETARSMIAIWYRSGTFQHGFFVLPISAWLIWRKRDVLAHISAHPFWFGLALVGTSGLLWLLAELAGVAVGAHLALVMMVQAALLTVLGLERARGMAFPLMFLLFAVPGRELLVPTLIEWIADFTVAALRVTGIPVYREGNHFMIPSGSWSVVETCSGIRYLIASLMVGTLYAYLTYHSATRRAVFIGLAILVPIVANWLRAYLIVMIGHLSSNQYAAGVDHLIYGWIFFGVVIGLLFWLGSFWRETGQPVSSAAPERSGRLRAIAMPARPGALVIAALAAIVVAAPWRPIDAAIEAGISDAPPALTRIESTNAWKAAQVAVADWRPHYAGYRADLRQTFESADGSVSIYIAYYSRQAQDRELVNSENVLVRADDTRWKRVAAGTQDLDWAGSSLAARSAVLSGADTRLDVLYWYWIDGGFTASDPIAKVRLALSKLRGRDDGSAVVMLYTAQSEDGRGLTRLRAFARDMSPQIERLLAGARHGGRDGG